MDQGCSAPTATFGNLLGRLRKRAGMTQEDLAAATGYSRSLIAALERDLRLPDVDAVISTYVPALGLQEEARLATQLVESAARARGEQTPAVLQLRTGRISALPPTAEAYRMPMPPTQIVGRGPEVNHLSNRLLGHHGRLLTLAGPPGVGKTRLALAVGAEAQEFYRDGACFVSLAPVTDPALAAPALLAALKVQTSSNKMPQARLIEHLRYKELLLVLDNFEQLLAAPSPAVALVVQLLAECPGLAVLVTSRERVHLRGEQRYLVQPLALTAAVELFVARCQDADSDFRLTNANRPVIEAICQEVDRLPLAIELCAGQIDLLSPHELLARLREHRLGLLVDGPDDLPPHQRTLRNAIGHSYDLLEEGERRLLRSLAVFAGGCDLEAITAVAAEGRTKPGAELLTMLHALIGKSLVRTEAGPEGSRRYLLLETIREFALEQARAHGEEDQLRERHYTAYLQLFLVGDPRLRRPDVAVWLGRLATEQDNLRAALQWTVDEGRCADTAWLLLAATWFWFQSGHWYELGAWIARTLPYRESLGADVRLATLINFHAVARASEQLLDVGRYTAEMLDLVAVSKNKILEAAALHFAAVYSADLSYSAAAWERSITCARQAREEPLPGPEYGVLNDCDFVLGHSLWSYADRLIEHGKFADAVPLLAETARLFEARGSRYEMADSLGTSGRLALLQGDLAKAHALLNDAVSLASEFNYREMVGTWQPFLALVALYEGDAARARRLLAESLHLCLELKDKALLARACTYLSETALGEGELAEAEEWLAQSLSYQADPRLVRIEQVERLLVAARLATAQRAYERAARLFGIAEAVRSRIGYDPAGPVRQLADAARDAACAALGLAAYEAAFAAGQQLPPEAGFATMVA